MAWFVIDYDDTLVQKQQETGQTFPTDGAVEAMQTLAGEGHRLTVFSERFAPMPAVRRQEIKEQIEQEIVSLGFPQMEVWTGTTKPAADIFIGDNMVTYDNDWGLALAQTQQMLEDRGLVNPPMPFDQAGQDPNDPSLSDPAAQLAAPQKPQGV